MGSITLCQWNVRGVMFSTPYLSKLLNTYKVQICAISEHWLYNDNVNFLNTIDKDFISVAVCDSSLDEYSSYRRGKGGVALIWHQSLCVTPLILPDEDRIIGICLHLTDCSDVYIFSVYLPNAKLGSGIFSEYVDRLYVLYMEYKQLGTVIILGDFNCEITGSRYKSRTSENSTKLANFLNDTSMYSIVTDSICKGPLYSYDPYDSGTNRSLIDHFVLEQSKADFVKSCEILSYNVLNMSDHLPILTCINVSPSLSFEYVKQARYLAWHKLSLEDINSKYTSFLEETLTKLNLDTVSPLDEKDIDDLYGKVVASCSLCAHSVPLRKYNPYLKPKWASHLKPLYKKMCQARQRWIDNGRPRGCNYHSYVSYKYAKRIFRCELRRSVQNREREIHEQVDNLSEFDLLRFWSAIRSKRASNKVKTYEVKFGAGPAVRDPDKIREGWANHFENLYTPLVSANFDNDHFNKITCNIKEFVMLSKNNIVPFLDSEINQSEVIKACRTLKNKKAPGFDHIMNEHLKYGGRALWTTFCQLFNAMLNTGHIPSAMQKGVIIPLIKNTLKSTSCPDNYRGITLLPVIYKLLERIILSRLEFFLHLRGIQFPDHLQFAYQSGLSSLHASYVFQESVNYVVENHSKVYSCLLDTSKAFDVVWIDGLFHKLY